VERRGPARGGWAGENEELFEHPAQGSEIIRNRLLRRLSRVLKMFFNSLLAVISKPHDRAVRLRSPQASTSLS
jgi:hypothetical protein